LQKTCIIIEFFDIMLPVTILSGFLGSGKTTTLRHLLRTYPNTHFAVIVNDMADLEVDGDLIRSASRFSEKNGNFFSLFAGSVSTSKRRSFQDALKAIAPNPMIEHLLIETSGSTHPAALVEDLNSARNFRVLRFITLVNAKTFANDFECGPGLYRQLIENENLQRVTTANLMLDQIRAADTILLSKIEALSAPQMDIIKTTLSLLQPGAEIHPIHYGKTDLEILSASPQPRSVEPANLQTFSASVSDYEMGHQVIRDPRPFHPQRLWDCVMNHLSLGIYRSKGFIWLASRPELVLLWNQSGGSIDLELLAYWKAAILNDPGNRLLPEEIEYFRQQLHGAHPIFGDRSNELTVIGSHIERQHFVRKLESCFCSSKEIAHWQKGGTFPDPWPRKLKTPN